MAKIKKLPPQKAKDPKKTFKRLFSEVFGENKLKLTVVIICIIISALSTVYISTLLKTLIDENPKLNEFFNPSGPDESVDEDRNDSDSNKTIING